MNFSVSVSVSSSVSVGVLMLVVAESLLFSWNGGCFCLFHVAIVAVLNMVDVSS